MNEGPKETNAQEQSSNTQEKNDRTEKRMTEEKENANGGGMSMSAELYHALGGETGIRRIVEAFYRRVAEDPILKPIFPEDLTETARKQFLFLTQFFGGPALYSAEFGAPMLRARHLRFPISPRRARRWLELMREAFSEAGIDPATTELAFLRLTKTAMHMVNIDDGEEDDPDAPRRRPRLDL